MRWWGERATAGRQGMAVWKREEGGGRRRGVEERGVGQDPDDNGQITREEMFELRARFYRSKSVTPQPFLTELPAKRGANGSRCKTVTPQLSCPMHICLSNRKRRSNPQACSFTRTPPCPRADPFHGCARARSLNVGPSSRVVVRCSLGEVNRDRLRRSIDGEAEGSRPMVGTG